MFPIIEKLLMLLAIHKKLRYFI